MSSSFWMPAALLLQSPKLCRYVNLSVPTPMSLPVNLTEESRKGFAYITAVMLLSRGA